MEYTPLLLKTIWIGSVVLLGISLFVSVILFISRAISDKRKIRNELRYKELQHALILHLESRVSNVKNTIVLHHGDKEILAKILEEMARIITGKKKEKLLDFLMQLGVYDQAVRVLKRGNLSHRLLAIRLLSNWQDAETKKHLAPLLKARKEVIRMEAIMALSSMGAKEFLPDIVKAAEKIETLSYPMLTDVFTKFGRSAAGTVTRVAIDSSAPLRLRMAAIRSTGTLGIAESIKKLTCLMSDPENEVRASFLRACEMIGDERAVPAVKAGLKDKVWFIRLRAAYCAKKILSRELIEPLSVSLSDSNWLVGFRSAEALYSIGLSGQKVLEIVSKESSVAGKQALSILEEKRALT